MFTYLTALLPIAALVAVAAAVPAELKAREGIFCPAGVTEYCCNGDIVDPTVFEGAIGGDLTLDQVTCKAYQDGCDDQTVMEACCQTLNDAEVTCSPYYPPQ